MDIRELPFFSNLYKDYVANFDDSPIKEFFTVPPSTDSTQFKQLLDWRLSRGEEEVGSGKRATLVNEVLAQQEQFGSPSPAAKKHLELLREKNTVAIVTGQQVSLFGGPLYSVFKAASAIGLAKQLAKQYPNFNFVPIFWLETEDHDIEEAADATVLDQTFASHTIKYTYQSELKEGGQWKRQVGPTLLKSEAISASIEELFSHLTPTEFTPRVRQLVEACYSAPNTFARAFAQLFQHWFSAEGLILIDANTPALKALGKDLFKKEIESTPALSKSVILNTVKLEEHYEPQVKPRAINLFYVEKGERFGIESNGEGFFLKGSRKTFTKKELLQTIESNPELISPNVLMRPLYQDTLLPTVAYVAGPGEVAYFAQFSTAYAWAGLKMPLIAPRFTATLIEEKFEKFGEKNSLELEKLIANGRDYLEQVLKSRTDPELESEFSDAEQSLEKTIEGLRNTVNATDKTLDQTLTTLKGKILTALRDFSSKTLGANRKKNSTLGEQLEKALAALLPNGELQERELSLVYFLNKYGPEFGARLKAHIIETPLLAAEHHLTPIRDLFGVPVSTPDLRNPEPAPQG